MGAPHAPDLDSEKLKTFLHQLRRSSPEIGEARTNFLVLKIWWEFPPPPKKEKLVQFTLENPKILNFLFGKKAIYSQKRKRKKETLDHLIPSPQLKHFNNFFKKIQKVIFHSPKNNSDFYHESTYIFSVQNQIKVSLFINSFFAVNFCVSQCNLQASQKQTFPHVKFSFLPCIIIIIIITLLLAI